MVFWRDANHPIKLPLRFASHRQNTINVALVARLLQKVPFSRPEQFKSSQNLRGRLRFFRAVIVRCRNRRKVPRPSERRAIPWFHQ